MKLFDKFLKKLKTNRNTFLTYILTLISIYILVDRVVELLFLFFMKFTFYHNNINVADLDKSIEFYQKALGLKITKRQKKPTEASSWYSWKLRPRTN